MADLIPEGFLSLTEAHEHYRARLWKGGDPAGELGDAAWFRELPAEIAQEHFERLAEIRQGEWDGLIKAFAGGELEALVSVPGRSQRYVIPR